jgi:hypothetical protein
MATTKSSLVRCNSDLPKILTVNSTESGKGDEVDEIDFVEDESALVVADEDEDDVVDEGIKAGKRAVFTILLFVKNK